MSLLGTSEQMICWGDSSGVRATLHLTESSQPTLTLPGFLHPIIHLGFGIEFNQPAIIAEALAQACCHQNWTGDFLLAAEKNSKSRTSTSDKTMPELLDQIRSNKKLSIAAEWTDGNKIRDGIMARASDEMLKYTSQWIVTPDNLEEKTAEMINSCIYYTAAAQNPPKQVKIDFYFMHCVNSSIFWPTFNAQSWLSTTNKVRLLQWKGYLDLAMYASRRSPPLLLSEITDYQPAKPKEADWNGIFERLFAFPDDGHAVKLGRAVRNGQLVSQAWEGKGKGEEGMKVQGDMWEKIGNMAIDSVEDSGAHWARSVGFEEAWTEYGDRPKKSQL
jgi:Questin oxidase-like